MTNVVIKGKTPTRKHSNRDVRNQLMDKHIGNRIQHMKNLNKKERERG